VLRDCVIPAPQLAPLLASGDITCLRLEGNSDLSDARGSNAGQGLLDLLSLSSPALTSLELTGVTQHFRPTLAMLAPPSPLQAGLPALAAAGDANQQEGVQAAPAAQLPALSASIRRLSLTCSGSLEAWAHVLPRLPALELVPGDGTSPRGYGGVFSVHA
jgi:hypothetical protein